MILNYSPSPELQIHCKKKKSIWKHPFKCFIHNFSPCWVSKVNIWVPSRRPLTGHGCRVSLFSQTAEMCGVRLSRGKRGKLQHASSVKAWDRERKGGGGCFSLCHKTVWQEFIDTHKHTRSRALHHKAETGESISDHKKHYQMHKFSSWESVELINQLKENSSL